MKFMHHLLLTLSVGIIAGCQQQSVSYPELPTLSPEQKKCVDSCLTLQDRCVKQYDSLYEQCSVQKKEQAKVHYQAYLELQAQKKEKASKKESDFLDLSSCKQQLDCPAMYAKCYDRCDI